jgi:hypothetical protein
LHLILFLHFYSIIKSPISFSAKLNISLLLHIGFKLSSLGLGVNYSTTVTIKLNLDNYLTKYSSCPILFSHFYSIIKYLISLSAKLNISLHLFAGFKLSTLGLWINCPTTVPVFLLLFDKRDKQSNLF